MDLLDSGPRHGASPEWPHSDAPIAVALLAVSGDGVIDVRPPPHRSARTGTCGRMRRVRVRVSRVLGLSGPWTAADLRATLDGVGKVMIAVRGRDSHGRLLADVVGICDPPPSCIEPTLGVTASGR